MTRVIAILVAALLTAAPPDARTIVADRVTTLTRASTWTLVASVPMAFRTFHPQGMVKIGNTFFVSSAEVIDRDTGKGIGHLFRIDKAGALIADLRLGEGAMYHPGGIDYDGRDICVPVAEYRPDSRTVVYRVDPATMKATEVFRVADHIGSIVHNTDRRTLHGVSWARAVSIAGRWLVIRKAQRSTRRTTWTIRTARISDATVCSVRASPSSARRATPPRSVSAGWIS